MNPTETIEDRATHVTVQGQRVPALGFGTWQLQGEECTKAVADALSIGYRHVDTAEAYENEEAVGRALARSDLDRGDYFLTTKVWWKELSHDECLEAAEASLRKLDVDYVDLLLVHWPDESIPLDEPLGAMKELRGQGKIRHMGVSNFTPALLSQALEIAPEILCNQVEYHPFLSQEPLLDMCRANEVMLTAYSPLARAEVMDDETLREIGEAHGKSPAQVTLRWLLQQENVAAIPRARSAEHREDNFRIWDFELDEEEMERIHGLDRGMRLIDPDFAPDWKR